MEYISTKDAAERLGLSMVRVQKLIRDKRLPAERIGRFYLIRESDLSLVKHRPPGRPKKQTEEPQASAA